MSNRFTSRLSDNDDYKRDELIRKIEHAVEHMTLSELEALSYDMFTKGYITDWSFASFTPHALKGQKLLAQGSALGYHVRKLDALFYSNWASFERIF